MSDTKEPNKQTDKSEMTELEKIRAERDEYLAGWQRAKADAVNAEKRMREDIKRFREMANQGLVEELLPVLQSFELAFANREAWEKADRGWRTGVEYIYNQLRGVLEQNGLSEINPMGQKFDPQRDEAASYEPVSDEKKDQTVLRVIEKGWALNSRTIKPPKVVVGEFTR